MLMRSFGRHFSFRTRLFSIHHGVHLSNILSCDSVWPFSLVGTCKTIGKRWIGRRDVSPVGAPLIPRKRTDGKSDDQFESEGAFIDLLEACDRTESGRNIGIRLTSSFSGHPFSSCCEC
jgi:hypothetical protein